MQDIDDPFALPEVANVAAKPAGPLSRGRYMLPWKDGTDKARGFMRVSNLVSAYSDQFGLRMWEIGEVLKGLETDPDLRNQLVQAHPSGMDRGTLRGWVEEFIEHAKDASGGNVGSKHGQQRHDAVEAYHAGLPMGHASTGTRRHLSLYAAALQRHELTALPGMQERIVLVEALEVCGRLDNILRDERTRMLHIGDLKTQKKFWTFLEIKAQFACYAHGDAMWEQHPDGSGHWVDMPQVDREIGLVLHMPRDAWEVQIWEVDLIQGWRTARRAFDVVRDRAMAKSVDPGAWLRPAPEATETERWAARFAAVETLAEGRQLVLEARKAGVWSEALASSAQAAHDRLAIPA